MQKNQVSKVERSNEMEFEALVGYEDLYEIGRDYPYPIRRKRDGYIVKEWNNGNGYIRMNLNNGAKSETRYKHILVAIQFIPNDDPINKKFADHINHNRSDYHISNLRWCTQASNCRNKSSHKCVDYDFVEIDYISDEVIDVLDFGNHQFTDEDYIYDTETDSFYYFNGENYRKLSPNKNSKTKVLFVCMRDINNNRVNVSFDKFKKIHGFI